MRPVGRPPLLVVAVSPWRSALPGKDPGNAWVYKGERGTLELAGVSYATVCVHLARIPGGVNQWVRVVWGSTPLPLQAGGVAE